MPTQPGPLTPEAANPRVVVTGAGHGIGLAVTRRLLNHGSRVTALDRDADSLEQLQAATGIDSEDTLAVDVRDPSACGAAARRILSRAPVVDALVNNAGTGWVGPLDEQRVDTWDRIMAVNARAPFLLAQGLLPGLKASTAGSVVNVGSVASHGFGNQVAYDASKGAVAALTRTLAVELGPHGIRVNAVAPGLIETRLMRAPALAGLVADSVPRLPLRRVGHVDEVAAVIAFLASAQASYITGQIVNVDGGWFRD